MNRWAAGVVIAGGLLAWAGGLGITATESIDGPATASERAIRHDPPRPPATPAPTAPTTTIDPRAGCEPAYPTICLPPAPPDLNCGDISETNFTALPPDPHRLDGDGNGIACES